MTPTEIIGDEYGDNINAPLCGPSRGRDSILVAERVQCDVQRLQGQATDIIAASADWPRSEAMHTCLCTSRKTYLQACMTARQQHLN